MFVRIPGFRGFGFSLGLVLWIPLIGFPGYDQGFLTARGTDPLGSELSEVMYAQQSS